MIHNKSTMEKTLKQRTRVHQSIIRIRLILSRFFNFTDDVSGDLEKKRYLDTRDHKVKVRGF